MTPAQFKDIRQQAGMTQGELGKYLTRHLRQNKSLRQVQRYEWGKTPIPGPVAMVMEQLREKSQARRP